MIVIFPSFECDFDECLLFLCVFVLLMVDFFFFLSLFFNAAKIRPILTIILSLVDLATKPLLLLQPKMIALMVCQFYFHYECTSVCVYVCVCACLCVCMCVCVHACMIVCVCVFLLEIGLGRESSA